MQYVVVLYRKAETTVRIWRHPTSGHEFEVGMHVSQTLNSYANGSKQPMEVYFCHSKENQDLVAETLVIQNPGLSVLKCTTAEMLATKVPTDLPITKSVISDKGILPK